MKIKEFIVVEGKCDTLAIQSAVKADTIETNGSAISEETLELIRRAQETRGVIIFTDPDYPGQKIRQTIIEQIPNCKHAFLSQEEASSTKERNLGVEHASKASIQRALKDAIIMQEGSVELISKDDLIDFDLIAGPKAKILRQKLGEVLRIGYTNGKQLHKRLMTFEISREEFTKAMNEVLESEKND